tara:strand:- start:43857 stop:44486 length:630 start_codon:yes stop_codon:yes gene_type:complete
MSANAAAPLVPSRKIPWALFILVALAGASTVFGSLAIWPDPVEGWLHAARYTARLSFLVFLAPFLAASLAYWAPSPLTRWLRAKRRYLGLSFALAHFIHLGALVMYLDLSGEGRSLITLLGGGGAYVMITLMALTSNDWSVRTLGPRVWGWLHWIGIYDIWFVFTFSYFGRVTKDVPQEPRIIYITLFGLALAALALRIATRMARRKRG